MRIACILFAILGVAGEAFVQPPAAVFDESYRKSNRGRISIEVPEVYELVNVALALTETGITSPNLIYQRSEYYKRLRTWFDPHRRHPAVLALDKALKESVNA